MGIDTSSQGRVRSSDQALGETGGEAGVHKQCSQGARPHPRQPPPSDPHKIRHRERGEAPQAHHLRLQRGGRGRGLQGCEGRLPGLRADS